MKMKPCSFEKADERLKQAEADSSGLNQIIDEGNRKDNTMCNRIPVEEFCAICSNEEGGPKCGICLATDILRKVVSNARKLCLCFPEIVVDGQNFSTLAYIVEDLKQILHELDECEAWKYDPEEKG